MKTKPHESRDCSCAACERWRQWVEGEEDGWRPSTGEEDWWDEFRSTPTLENSSRAVDGSFINWLIGYVEAVLEDGTVAVRVT